MKHSGTSRVTWLRTSPASDAPAFLEEDIEGPVTEAIKFAKNHSVSPGFLMAQVLAADGRVLVNIAPGGMTRFN